MGLLTTKVELERKGTNRTLIRTTTTASIPTRSVISIAVAVCLIGGMFAELVFDKASQSIGLIVALFVFVGLVWLLAKSISKALSGVWEVDLNTQILKRIEGFTKQTWSQVSLPSSGRVVLRQLHILRQRASGGAGSDPFQTLHRLTLQEAKGSQPGVLPSELREQAQVDQETMHSSLKEIPLLPNSELLMALGNGVLPFRLGVALARATGYDLADLAVSPASCIESKALEPSVRAPWLPWVDVNLPKTFYQISGLRPPEIKELSDADGTLVFGSGKLGRNIFLALIAMALTVSMAFSTQTISPAVFGLFITLLLVAHRSVCRMDEAGIQWHYTLLGVRIGDVAKVEWQALRLLRLKSRPTLSLEFATQETYQTLVLPSGDMGAWLVGAIAVSMAKYSASLTTP